MLVLCQKVHIYIHVHDQQFFSSSETPGPHCQPKVEVLEPPLGPVITHRTQKCIVRIALNKLDCTALHWAGQGPENHVRSSKRKAT